jgi:hypothetical protein
MTLVFILDNEKVTKGIAERKINHMKQLEGSNLIGLYICRMG